MFKIFLTVFVFFFAITEIICDCPDPELFKPCTCATAEAKDFRTVHCNSNESYDLGKVFEKISNNTDKSGKNYQAFFLTNTANTELRANTFKDITFDEIYIQDTSISQVNAYAFNGTDKLTRYIEFNRNPDLSGSPHFFKALRGFTNVQGIKLSNNNLTEIPDNAFQNPQGQNLAFATFTFEGKDIKKIGSNAFSDYNNLMAVRLYDTSIDYIPDNAFAFSQHITFQDDSYFYIGLRGNPLTASSFSKDAFSGINTKTILDFETEYPSIRYLNQNVFLPFFSSNPTSQLYASLVNFDCQDCTNVWIINEIANVQKLVCSNGKPLNDKGNFKNC